MSHLPDFFGAAFGIYVVCRVILRTLPAKVSYMGVFTFFVLLKRLPNHGGLSSMANPKVIEGSGTL